MSLEIICADAIPWLRERREIGSVITSLPDQIETGQTVAEWIEWFVSTIALCMTAASRDAVSIIYQTDRKADGRWRSKSHLIYQAAARAGVGCLWHKIVIRGQLGKVDLYRPGYSHLIAFSHEARPGKATPDVIERGDILYQNAIGLNPANVALELAARCEARVVDPFCGRGTIPILAHRMGLEAIGIDIDAEQCAAARRGQSGPAYASV